MNSKRRLEKEISIVDRQVPRPGIGGMGEELHCSADQ
jgi:hypothetical protein